MMTRFVPATELRTGDTILDEEGRERVVTLAIVEGDRTHLLFGDPVFGSEEVVLTKDDVVEVRCGDGAEEHT